VIGGSLSLPLQRRRGWSQCRRRQRRSRPAAQEEGEEGDFEETPKDQANFMELLQAAEGASRQGRGRRSVGWSSDLFFCTRLLSEALLSGHYLSCGHHTAPDASVAGVGPAEYPRRADP
jgi:hypothetical protein